MVIKTAIHGKYNSTKMRKANAFKGSRATGALLTPTHVYAVYNTGSAWTGWRDSIEQRYKAEIRGHIVHGVLMGQYGRTLGGGLGSGRYRSGEHGSVKGDVGGIIIGESLEVLEEYWIAPRKSGASLAFLTNTYHPFYFITNNIHGELQLKLLCDHHRMTVLHSTLSKNHLPQDPAYPIEHDALTKDGDPVLFCCLLDIPRLLRFRAGLSLHGRNGVVMGFDFQREMLRRCFGEMGEMGEMVEFVSLSHAKVMNWLFPVI